MRDGSRLWAWLLAALGVILVAASIAVAVTAVNRSSTEAARPPSARSPAESARVRAAADRVYGSFAGTIEQRNAGLALRAYGQNGGMDACLEAAGFPEWDWSKSRQYAAPTDPLRYSTWLGEPHRPFRSEYLMAERRRIRAESTMNRDHIGPAEDAAIGHCLDSGPHRRAVHVDTTWEPKAARHLWNQWYAMVQAVDRQGPSQVRYDACMDDAHISALVDSGLPASRLGEAISRLGPVDSAIPSSTHDPKAQAPAWRRFLASEKEITDADWQCREGTYDALMARLGPEIDAFATRHAAEIQAARAGWREIAAQARLLGFTGQSGSLDS